VNVDVECILEMVNIDTVMQEKFQTRLTIKYKSKVCLESDQTKKVSVNASIMRLHDWCTAYHITQCLWGLVIGPGGVCVTGQVLQ